MKKILVIIVNLSVSVIINAQDISYAEYFIDTDPGYGMAIPITVPEAGTDVSLGFTADIALISPGLHFLTIRTRDDLGRWSTGTNRVFYHVKTVAVTDREIHQAEYFIDTDPGYGKAVSIPVSTPENELTLNFTANIQDLSQGIHSIHFRARDISGRWTTVMHGIFVNVIIPSSTESNIHQVEYFMDTDPGYGNGTQVTLPSVGSDLNIDFNVSLNGLDNGNHVLYVRAKNEQNKWGQVFAEVFALNPTGVDQEEIITLFKIYPNPGMGNFRFELSDNIQQPLTIQIMDLTGKLVHEEKFYNNRNELILNLPGGTYLFTVETDQTRITQKIIIK